MVRVPRKRGVGSILSGSGAGTRGSRPGLPTVAPPGLNATLSPPLTMKLFQLGTALAALAVFAAAARAADGSPAIVLEGKDGPGKGKPIVLISGDQEYRSEETI